LKTENSKLLLLDKTSARQNADLVRVDFFRKQDLILITKDLSEAQNLGSSIRDKLVEARYEDPEEGSINVLKYETDVVPNNPDKSNIYLIFNGGTLTNAEGDTNLWEMEYFHWKLPAQSCGTYELITPSEAFDEVKSGNGYLVKLQKKFGGDPFADTSKQVVKEISILSIELVYLDTRAKQDYLQPIYRLSGEAVLGDNTKANIVFYVPALKTSQDEAE
jgi:hypothetical protein